MAEKIREPNRWEYVLRDGATSGIQKQPKTLVQRLYEVEKLKKDMKDEAYKLRMQATLPVELTAHAKSTCLELATEFYATMPRELRNLVYSYLHRSVDTPKDRRGQDTMEPRPDHLRRLTPVWQSKEYVGYEFAREYTEFFYEHTQLQFRTRWCSVEALDNLLLRDPFGYGITPIKLIRSLYITLQGPGNNCFESFRDQSKVLFRLGKRTHVTFRIQLDMIFEDETRQLGFLLKSLEFLAYMLYKFKQADRSFDVFIVFGSRVPTDLARNIKPLWDVPQKHLLAKIKSWSTSYELAKATGGRSVFACKLKVIPLKKESDYLLLKWMLNVSAPSATLIALIGARS